jgi:uncharacterized protein YdiU (UPF0061 family)
VPAAAGDEEPALAPLQALPALWLPGDVHRTLFSRGLAAVDPAPLETATTLPAPLRTAFYDPQKLARLEPDFLAWLRAHGERVRQDGLPPAVRRAAMDAVNPRFVLRNYLAQQAIDRAEQGDYAGIEDLLEVMRQPFAEQPGREPYAARRPDWARDRAGCSMLSCST